MIYNSALVYITMESCKGTVKSYYVGQRKNGDRVRMYQDGGEIKIILCITYIRCDFV